MISADIASDEDERLQDLWEYEVLDTPEEDSFNEIVELASWICKTPMSAITLIDTSRQWLKAKKGLEGTGSSRDTSFCAHTILEKDHLIINDTVHDKRFSGNPSVTGKPDIRFYAGVPLISPKGHNLGALCVVDIVPRRLSKDQLKALKILSRQVMDQLKLRLYNKHLKTESGVVKESNKVLTKLNDIKDKLFTVVSHDIRTPLASIQNSIELFKEGLFSKEEFDMILGELHTKVKHTTSFIDNLLYWAKSQYDGIKAKKIKFNIKDIIDETLILLYSTAESKHITFKNHMAHELYVCADPDMARIIIRNLVANAIKFCRPGDTISVGLDKLEGNKAVLYVSDTGSGMNEETRRNLFRYDLFYTSAGTNNETGTGIGLILCKDLLAKNEGSIWVESTENKGTTFFFTLPMTL